MGLESVANGTIIQFLGRSVKHLLDIFFVGTNPVVGDAPQVTNVTEVVNDEVNHRQFPPSAW